jgi:hypothetical protein
MRPITAVVAMSKGLMRIADEIAMQQHSAFGNASGPAGVLQECDVAAHTFDGHLYSRSW